VPDFFAITRYFYDTYIDCNSILQHSSHSMPVAPISNAHPHMVSIPALYSTFSRVQKNTQKEVLSISRYHDYYSSSAASLFHSNGLLRLAYDTIADAFLRCLHLRLLTDFHRHYVDGDIDAALVAANESHDKSATSSITIASSAAESSRIASTEDSSAVPVSMAASHATFALSVCVYCLRVLARTLK
jgi:hypothetical protein